MTVIIIRKEITTTIPASSLQLPTLDHAMLHSYLHDLAAPATVTKPTTFYCHPLHHHDCNGHWCCLITIAGHSTTTTPLLPCHAIATMAPLLCKCGETISSLLLLALIVTPPCHCGCHHLHHCASNTASTTTTPINFIFHHTCTNHPCHCHQYHVQHHQYFYQSQHFRNYTPCLQQHPPCNFWILTQNGRRRIQKSKLHKFHFLAIL